MKKVRMSLIALALTLSIGGAFATKSNIKSGSTLYGIISIQGDQYEVALASEGDCDQTPNVKCTVLSDAMPVDNLIPQAGTTDIDAGVFSVH